MKRLELIAGKFKKNTLKGKKQIDLKTCVSVDLERVSGNGFKCNWEI